MKKLMSLIVIVGVAALLSACGRRGALETPVSYEQAIPGTSEARAAANPPKGPDGKSIRVPTQPGPVPASDSFILDPLLD